MPFSSKISKATSDIFSDVKSIACGVDVTFWEGTERI